MLSPETKSGIAALVRSGFYDQAQLIYLLCEEMYAPGELDPAEVSSTVEAEFLSWKIEKASYPDITDCDRLDLVFAAMKKHGLIALQNAGYTQSDGYDDFVDEYEDSPDKSDIIGYCFYHGQDLERAIHGGGLYFAFGPVDPNEEETKGAEIGHIVREELERVGFEVDWDGTFSNRLHVPNLKWQRQ